MKLRNKKTGEIGKNEGEDIDAKRFCIRSEKTGKVYVYDSLGKLNAEWEDCEEPKMYWYVADNGEIKHDTDDNDKVDNFSKAIGNYFETEEEAEKAVEKLKALRKLRDKGFEFDGWTIDDGLKISICTNFDGENIYSASEKEIKAILDLLFGGEE